MPYATQSLITSTPSETLNPSQGTLDARLWAALEHARRLTTMYGVDNPDVAIAWDTFEELLTAQARRAEAVETSPSRFADSLLPQPLNAPE
ncbi:MAG: hypothetical protein HC922_05990, partial [Leptolyngbyaceae cyanobacterium SM2_3_12]|nr:hypothetical protein [Leptolyngbyaceae cyanobacterium SM2_3_12]